MKTANIITLSVLLSLLAACGKSPEITSAPPAAMPVQVATPIQKEITVYSEYTGRLEAVEIVEVKPRVSGYIESIHFKEGKNVKKGDLLYIIDDRPFAASVNQLKAKVKQEEAALALAEANLKRAEQLIGSNAISREEIDIRRSEALQEKANLAAAKASLEAGELEISFTRVTAPIDGITDRQYVTVGNLVTGDVTELTTIVPHSPIYAYYEIDERSFLQGVRRFFDGKSPGRDSDASIPAFLGLDDEEGHPHVGSMNFAGNQLDPNTATMTVRAIFENKDEFLTPGLFARIKIPVSKSQNRILIPDTSINTDLTIKYVWVVSPDNKPERRPLELGPKHDGYRVVYSGLEATDRVIITGIQFIRPGMDLAPTEVDI